MTIREIPVGEFLSFGQFIRRGSRSTDDIFWRKASSKNEFYSDGSIGKFCADAQEPENESRDRRERGSNFFPQTNICQFLNSTEKDWFKPQHETDTADTTLKNQPGFLSLFDEWERKLIIPHEITTVVPVGFRRKYGEQVKTTLKVSMLSKSQLFSNVDQYEDEQLELFANGSAPPIDLLTRSAVNTGLVAIDRRGRLVNQCPALECNITPFICLDGDYPVEFSSAEGYYYLLPPTEIAKEVTDELHQLLK